MKDSTTKGTKATKEKNLRALPDGWAWTTLEKCVDILDNLRNPINSDEREQRIAGKEQSELYPYYGATGLVGWIDDFIFDEEIVLLGEDGAPFLEKTKDKAYIVRGKCWVNNHAHVLRAKNGVTTNLFLMHYLNIFDYHNYVSGTTRLKLNQGRMREFPIILPPLPEQERIVARLEELLSDLEAGVAALARVRAGVKRYKASVLKAACEGKLFGEKGIVNGELPEGWRWVTVEEISQKIQYGTSEKANLDDSGIPVLRMGNVQDGELDYTDLKYLPEDVVPDNLILEPGDLIFNRTNSAELVGKTAIYKSNHPKATFASYLIRVKLVPDCSPDYLSYFINSVHGRKYISSVVSQQVGQANVNGTKLANMPIPLPPTEEQQHIVAEVERRLESARAVESAVEMGLKRAARLRQSVLRSAFEGRLG